MTCRDRTNGVTTPTSLTVGVFRNMLPTPFFHFYCQGVYNILTYLFRDGPVEEVYVSSVFYRHVQFDSRVWGQVPVGTWNESTKVKTHQNFRFTEELSTIISDSVITMSRFQSRTLVAVVGRVGVQAHEVWNCTCAHF